MDRREVRLEINLTVDDSGSAGFDYAMLIQNLLIRVLKREDLNRFVRVDSVKVVS